MGTDPNKKLKELQNTIQIQQLKIDSLNQNLGLTQRELKLARSEINHDLSKRLLPVKIIGIIIIILGVPSVFSFYKKMEKVETSVLAKMTKSLDEKVQVQISKRLIHIDPTNVPLHVPRDNFESELKRLHRFGFRNFKHYTKLEEISLEGVVIIPLYKDPSIDPSEKEKIKQFIIMSNPDSDKVGFLFYKIYSGSFPDDLLNIHSIIDYSSNMTTLSPNVLNIARSIERFEAKQSK